MSGDTSSELNRLSNGPRWRRFKSAGLAAAACCLGISTITACSSGSVSIKGSRVDVTVRDFKIDAPKQVPAGTVTFVVHGTGPMLHEFNVAWTDLAATKLALKPDDTVDDEHNSADFIHLGEVEGIEMDGTKSLTVQLESGKTYVLYCNMEGHYMAGMTTIVTAT